MEEMQNLEEEILALKERNSRVEAEKAWETSKFRVFSIAIITYLIASIVLWLIGTKNYFLSALVPTVGYLLSTQSLPVIKKWWITKYLDKK